MSLERAIFWIEATLWASRRTVTLDARRTATTPWKGRTQSGYGPSVPTNLMVKYNGRWRRVKAAVFGNVGTAYIGKPGEWIATIQD